MKHIKKTMVIAALLAAPALADDESDHRNIISTFIQMSGHPCLAVVGNVEQVDDSGTDFNVTCAANADGSGAQQKYNLKLTDTGANVTVL